jgi:hypothetical protein
VERRIWAGACGLGFQPKLCADGVADHGERCPCAYQQAVATHEAAAVADIKEGAPEFFHGSALLAETVAGGQVEHPDADDGEEEKAGDPDVACNVVLLDARDKEAADHGNQEGEDGADDLGWQRVGIRVGEGHAADGDGENKHREKGVGEEPERLATEVAEGLALRNVLPDGHSVSKVSLLRLLHLFARQKCTGYVFCCRVSF